MVMGGGALPILLRWAGGSAAKGRSPLACGVVFAWVAAAAGVLVLATALGLLAAVAGDWGVTVGKLAG
jgi:hypothetical protein